MARLITCGFEAQQLSVNSPDPLGDPTGGTPPTITTSVVRSGSAAIAFTPSNFGSSIAIANAAGVAGTTYYIRYYYRKTANSAVNANTLSQHSFASGVLSVLTDTNGTIYLNGGTGVSSALATNTWYRIELSVTCQSSGNGTAILYVDGTQVSTKTEAWTTLSANLGLQLYGPFSNTGDTGTYYYDDIAINDSTGASNNGLPGSGKIILLKPVSDNARTGYVAGASGTTNLYTAVDNTPPIGVASGSATVSSQIGSKNNNTTDTYSANITSYSTAGITASDTINAIQAVAQIGNSTNNARSQAIQVTSNPAIAEATTASQTTSAGTSPTNWKRAVTVHADAPSVTLATQPVMRIRKATATGDNVMCDFMGLIVDYTPIVQIAVSLGKATETDTSQASSKVKNYALTRPTEIDSVLATSFGRGFSLQKVTQTSIASALSKTKIKQLGQATSSSVAIIISVYKQKILGIATEIISVFSVPKMTENHEMIGAMATINESLNTATVFVQFPTASISSDGSATGTVNESVHPTADIQENF